MKNNTTLSFLSICHSLLDCIQTLLFSNVTKHNQLSVFPKVLQCNLWRTHLCLCCTSHTFFPTDSHYSSLQSFGTISKLLSCLLTLKPGHKNPTFTLALQKQTISIPKSVELFRGLSTHKAGEKKSLTFKAETRTDSLSVLEENTFIAVNKQSAVKEPAPESMKAVASSLSPKPSVWEIIPE